MKTVAVEALLAIAIASTWLTCLGFVRLKTALDRLHCATFLNVVAGLSLAGAVVVQDGATSRAWKTVALVLATLLVGAATSHAVGRALYLRGPEER